MTYAPFRQLWRNRPNLSTPVTAEALNHIEAGIKAAHDLGGRNRGPHVDGMELLKFDTVKFAGSLWEAQEATVDPPIVGVDLAGHVASAAFTRIGAMSLAGERVGLFDGSVDNTAVATVVENDTHAGWAGASVSVVARVDTGSLNRVFQLGILAGDKPASTTPLRASNSGFWGIQIGGNHAGANNGYVVANGALGSVNTLAAGVGTTGAGESTYRVEFRDVGSGSCVVIAYKDGAELFRDTRPAPTAGTFRVAIGAHSASSTGNAVVAVTGRPIVGAQSPKFKRLHSLAEL